MGISEAEGKSKRLLSLHTRLMRHELLYKTEIAQEFGVTERSVQRDIEDLRCFFAEQVPPRELVYDIGAKGYRLTESSAQLLSNGEILAVCKILLDSRALVKDEMLPVLDKLVSCCVPEQNKKAVSTLIANEKFHYIEPHHGRNILDDIWRIGQAIETQQLMEITYCKLKDPTPITRLIEPVGLMVSEYYFYLTAFLRDVDKAKSFENKDDLSPTIYRLDRIQAFKVLPQHFQVPYKDRFE
ncbi:MAG: WYL domain-containing protein, partial [Oscillospiraceae bacterium]